MSKSDMSEAEDFIRKAKKLGCTPEIDGNWIKFTPLLNGLVTGRTRCPESR